MPDKNISIDELLFICSNGLSATKGSAKFLLHRAMSARAQSGGHVEEAMSESSTDTVEIRQAYNSRIGRVTQDDYLDKTAIQRTEQFYTTCGFKPLKIDNLNVFLCTTEIDSDPVWERLWTGNKKIPLMSGSSVIGVHSFTGSVDDAYSTSGSISVTDPCIRSWIMRILTGSSLCSPSPPPSHSHNPHSHSPPPPSRSPPPPPCLQSLLVNLL